MGIPGVDVGAADGLEQPAIIATTSRIDNSRPKEPGAGVMEGKHSDLLFAYSLMVRSSRPCLAGRSRPIFH